MNNSNHSEVIICKHFYKSPYIQILNDFFKKKNSNENFQDRDKSERLLTSMNKFELMT